VTETEAKAEAVRHWWDKAHESLDAARRELAAGAHAFAVNRAYYALFYAVSALLLQEGRRFRKHSGVRAALNREIIKTGRIGRKFGDLYNELFDDRHAGDYIAFTKFDAPMCRRRLKLAKSF